MRAAASSIARGSPSASRRSHHSRGILLRQGELRWTALPPQEPDRFVSFRFSTGGQDAGWGNDRAGREFILTIEPNGCGWWPGSSIRGRQREGPPGPSPTPGPARGVGNRSVCLSRK